MIRPHLLSGADATGASMLIAWLVAGEKAESRSLAPRSAVRAPRSACGSMIDSCGGAGRESAPPAPSQVAKSAPAANEVTTSTVSGLGGLGRPVVQDPISPNDPLRKSHT